MILQLTKIIKTILISNHNLSSTAKYHSSISLSCKVGRLVLTSKLDHELVKLVSSYIRFEAFPALVHNNFFTLVPSLPTMMAQESGAESLELFQLTRLTAREEIIMNKRRESFKSYITYFNVLPFYLLHSFYIYYTIFTHNLRII